MEQENKGQTIYFKDLLFCVLHQWKWLVIATLVGAILLGGVQILGSNQEVSIDSVTIMPETQEKLDMLLDTEERLNASIVSHSAYLENSVLMTLDPYTAISSGIYLQAFPEGIADSEAYNHKMAAIFRSYYAELMSASTMDQLAQSLQIESVYLRELISTDFSNESYLTITARGRDQQEAEAIRDVILQTLESCTAELCQTLGQHTISAIGFTIGPRVDNGLYDTQKTAQQKLTTLTNSLTSNTTEINRLLPQQLTSGDENPIIFAGVGGAMGFCFVVALALLMHLASGKVYSARLVQDQTEVKVLGCLKGKKHNAIDSWLRKLEGRAQEDAAPAIATNIANRTKDTPELLLLGSYDAASLQPLAEALEKLGKRCTLCADPAKSAQAMAAIDQCQVAILVETCGISTYENIIWEKDTIADYSKNLLGCVVIEG